MDPLAELIRRCRVLPPEGPTDQAAWETFLSEVRRMIRGSRRYYGLDGFEEWIIGWFATPRPVNPGSADPNRPIDQMWHDIQQGTSPLDHDHNPEPNNEPINILWNKIQSARKMFERENRLAPPRFQRFSGVDLNQHPGLDPLQQEIEQPHEVQSYARLLPAVKRLQQDFRIPFWLTYLGGFGPLLPEEDLRRLESRCPDVQKIINEHYAVNQSIDGTTIGQWMGISRNLVYQRKRTALLDVRKALGLPTRPPPRGD
jgi:hypothetical protein